MSNKKAAVLVLADGTQFKGFSFGAEMSVSGEVVFNIAMLGYPELLSDPASRGQILVLTYPLVGNYGVPPMDEENGLLWNFESAEMQIAALVVTDYSEEYSHWNASESLAAWLKKSGVPAICGVDTRELAKHIRRHGEMAGRVIIEGAPGKESGITNRRQVEGRRACSNDRDAKEKNEVNYELRGEYGHGDITVCVVGGNIKNNVIRSLVRREAKVTTDPALPWDGLLVTGCPGDPKTAGKTVENIKKALAGEKPVFGVCGGDTLLALAAGGDTYKMKNGHRGAAQPVLETGTNSASITSQNHGYAVDAASLPKGWEVWYTNLNDGTCEGIRHKTKPFSAVQFHPEAIANPVEADKLYDRFVDTVRKHKK